MNSINPVIRHIVYIGTYSPRLCGIATFTQDLLTNMRLLYPAASFGVFAMNQDAEEAYAYPTEVIHEISQNTRSTYMAAANKINAMGAGTVVIVQHEYGIYQNSYLLALMQALTCPIITTFHTVIKKPTESMLRMTQNLLSASAHVVVLTDTSRTILATLYPSEASKIVRILHGIHPRIFTTSESAKPLLKLMNHRVLLTFGLLGRNKGIEYVIRALPDVAAKSADVLYLVVGKTHPNVLRHEGETYRNELKQLVRDLKLKNHVRFVDSYLSTGELLSYLDATDIYIAPSIDPQQAVSGTLSYALGAGRAVVATEFAQAKEIVHPSVGITVPIGEPSRMARAINLLLGDKDKLQHMNRDAYQSTRAMLWPNVADDYLALVAEVLQKNDPAFLPWPEPTLKRLEKLTDAFGLIQFSQGVQPDKRSGYTLDDNCRALQALDQLAKKNPAMLARCNKLANIYIHVVEKCLSKTPPINYLATGTYQPTSQNSYEDLEDSLARANYALESVAYGPLDAAKSARKLLRTLPRKVTGNHLRPIAFRLLGACSSLEAKGPSGKEKIHALAQKLVAAYEKNSTADWQWFEPQLTYANGILCASLLQAAKITGNSRYKTIALQALEFISTHSFMGPVYAPIGQAGWYTKGGNRALFDQQPEDVAAMLVALVKAYQLTGKQIYVRRGKKAFSWFMGNNLLGTRMYDDTSGGAHDGLTPAGPNANQGAESAISFIMARLSLEELVAAASIKAPQTKTGTSRPVFAK